MFTPTRQKFRHVFKTTVTQCIVIIQGQCIDGIDQTNQILVVQRRCNSLIVLVLAVKQDGIVAFHDIKAVLRQVRVHCWCEGTQRIALDGIMDFHGGFNVET